jgi:hypothetical protein
LLLASLYLPWRAASCSEGSFGAQSGSVCGLLHTFSGGLQANDGLSSEVGPAAALFALLLIALAATSYARRGLAGRLPLGRCALLGGYFAIAVGIETRSEVSQPEINGTSHYAYGAYVGLAATIVVLVAAAVARREELPRYRSASALAMLVLVGALLLTFLLPWWEQRVLPAATTSIGIASPALVVAAALALILPRAWSDPVERLGLVAAIALFTGVAAGSSPDFLVSRAYGVWLGLAAVGAIVLLVLVNGPRTVKLGEASWHELGVGAAAALFFGGLFLPWQRWCYGAGRDFGPLAGRCISTNAWTTYPLLATVAGVLAVALVVAMLQPPWLGLSVVELAASFGIVVTTLGFALQEGGSDGFHVSHGYGSTIGFIIAAVLVLLALLRSGLPAVDWHRVPARLVPMAACVSYLVIVVLPWWILNPDDGRWNLSFPAFTWLTVTGAILGIHLLALWARRITGAPAGSQLVLLPLALLALATVELVVRGDFNRGWGAVAGLCLLLAILGQIEQRRGLDGLRVPEALRLDRL